MKSSIFTNLLDNSKTPAQISRERELLHALPTIRNLDLVKGCREKLKIDKLGVKTPNPTHKFLVRACYYALSKQEEASLDSGIVLRFAIAS